LLKFVPKLKPLSHQARLFEETKDRPGYSIHWEQGTGKTKIALDTFYYLYSIGEVDSLFVIAPNGVQINWIEEEWPKHVPDNFRGLFKLHYYQTNRAKTQWHKRAVEGVIKAPHGAVMAMSYNSIMTEAGKKAAQKFLKSRRCMYILDESHMIKNPDSKRTKRIVASGRYAKYKRVLTGTPISQGPFDLYPSQRFIDANFWLDRGLYPYAVYKSYFGVWRTRAQVLAEEGYDPKYDLLLGYKNLSRLKDIMEKHSDRVLKKDVLDLPEQVYVRRYYELSPKQRNLYDTLLEEYIVFMEDGEFLEAAMVIVRMLRLQQITSGFYKIDPESPIQHIDGPNPRLEALIDYCNSIGDSQAVIWARFRPEVDMVLEKLGKGAIRYDGGVDQQTAWDNQEAWKNGDYQWLVANPAKGATGLTWHNANYMLFFSNDYNFVNRKQAEARIHRIGQNDKCTYVDFVGINTLDPRILDNLLTKQDISDQITGDDFNGWLQEIANA